MLPVSGKLPLKCILFGLVGFFALNLSVRENKPFDRRSTTAPHCSGSALSTNAVVDYSRCCPIVRHDSDQFMFTTSAKDPNCKNWEVCSFVCQLSFAFARPNKWSSKIIAFEWWTNYWMEFVFWNCTHGKMPSFNPSPKSVTKNCDTFDIKPSSVQYQIFFGHSHRFS